MNLLLVLALVAMIVMSRGCSSAEAPAPPTCPARPLVSLPVSSVADAVKIASTLNPNAGPDPHRGKAIRTQGAVSRGDKWIVTFYFWVGGHMRQNFTSVIDKRTGCEDSSITFQIVEIDEDI